MSSAWELDRAASDFTKATQEKNLTLLVQPITLLNFNITMIQTIEHKKQYIKIIGSTE